MNFSPAYTSFHYLRDLAVDGIKVDKSFVHGVLTIAEELETLLGV